MRAALSLAFWASKTWGRPHSPANTKFACMHVTAIAATQASLTLSFPPWTRRLAPLVSRLAGRYLLVVSSTYLDPLITLGWFATTTRDRVSRLLPRASAGGGVKAH